MALADLIAREFPWDYAGLARVLNVSPGALKFYAYTPLGRAKSYRTFQLQKRTGGSRTIHAPSAGLYKIQRAILNTFLTSENLKNRYSVYSYTAGRSAPEMAGRHVARDFVVRIDLEDFFGSITFLRVLGALKTFPLNIPHTWATIIAQLCTYEGGLPQGAPTSPAISNVITRRMDGELIRFAKEYGFRYTRYSDDLIFSGTTRRKLSAIVSRDEKTFAYVVAEPIRSIIEGNNFKVNHSKTRVALRRQKQVVVGTVVNEKVNVDRHYVRQIRTLLHLARKSPKNALEAHHKWSGQQHAADIGAVLKGRIEYVRLLKGSSDSVFVSLAEDFNAIFVNQAPIKVTHGNKSGAYTEKHALICKGYHKNYNDPTMGDSNEAIMFKTGTCFFLDGIGLVTSFHNLLHRVEVFPAENPSFNIPITHAKFCDPKSDVAILDGKPVFSRFYRMLKAEKIRPIQPGDEITILGYPSYVEGDKISVTSGKITQEKERFGMKLYAVSMNIKEGESGGPVLNDRGRVIGIVRSNASDHFVVPIRYVIDVAARNTTLHPLDEWEADFYGFGEASPISKSGRVIGKIPAIIRRIASFFKSL